MAYPDQLLYDYYANVITDEFGIDNIADPLFEIADDSAETTSYRFANSRRQGTCYIKFDRSKV